MANHKSSLKRARQTEKRTVRNNLIRGRTRKALRSFREAVGEKNADKIKTTLQTASRELQRAGSRGVFHARNVSRRISRLTQAANKALQS